MFNSVRGRITLIATGFVAIALLLASVLIVRMVESDLLATTERAYRAELELAATALDPVLAFVGTGVVERTPIIEVQTGTRDFGLGMFMQEDEAFLAFGTVFGDDDIPIGEVALDTETMTFIEVFDPVSGELLEDQSLRSELEELTFEGIDFAGANGNSFLVGAIARTEVDESIGAVRNALLLIVPALTAMLGVLIWALVGRALRPVQAISDEVQAISSTNLDRRVPVPSGNDEVSGLATVMNHMLTRLQRGDARQRQFAADASHELRSPLATVRAAAEIIEHNPNPERAGRLASDIVAEADRMDALIGDLLALSRVDEKVAARSHGLVDLAHLVRSIGSNASDGDSIKLSVNVHVEEAIVIGDEPQLYRALDNLIRNAQRHAKSTVSVCLALVHRGPARVVEVCVEDDGEGVPFERRLEIFERFSRLDTARSRDQGGSGLGLALVNAIASRHRGTISVDDSPALGGARFALHIPVAPGR